MNCNKWTRVLLGAGLIGLPGLLQAEEKPSTVLTSLEATTLSGYVDTSAHWNLGTGNATLPPYTPNGVSGTSKADGFNLDVVALTLNKPAGDGWSAGYNATLLFGPDAVGYNPSFGGASGDFSLKDTYVDLHAPIGNGLDVKLGTFASLLGYEVYETGNNPNYTRSYGYMIEPTSLTGVMATYQLLPELQINGAILDTWSAGINSRAWATTPARAESFKTYMADMVFTAPTNWGVLGGSTLAGGVLTGWDAVNLVNKTSWYIGGTINTPITGVKVGVAVDYANLAQNNLGAGGAQENAGYQNAYGAYINWQATEKLSFNTRGEYFSQSGYLAAAAVGSGVGLPKKAVELTETIQYDLWKNVVSRLEFRWDHAADASGIFSGKDNAYLLAANFVYKF
jgi:hypothetical protein